MTTTESITLRGAVPEDSAFLARLYSDTRCREVNAWGWPLEQQKSFLRMQFDAQRRSYQAQFPEALDNLVLCDDAPIGRVLTCRDGPSIRLIDIALMEKRRGQGIGTFLLHQLLDECRARDRVLYLQVARGNPAIRLYERLGFTQVGDDPVYLQMEWRPLSV